MATSGLKIIVDKPPIPVAYGPAFEGERIRKEDMFMEFGGARTPAFEWVRTREKEEIEDGKVSVVGNNWQEKYEQGGKMPLGIVIDVAGRKMQKDFEGVIERKIHHNINEAQGIWHMGQRDINWIRINNNAKKEGFTLEHLGIINATMTHARLKSIVDKDTGDNLYRRIRSAENTGRSQEILQGTRPAARRTCG